MDAEYETVHTVTRYWDGPRGGVADYQGSPHADEVLFNEKEDDWSSLCLLRPIDQETFRLALEDWRRWLRWRAAYDEGRTSLETHPVLPEDQQRHEEIQPVLEERLTIDPRTAIRARGDFRIIGGEWCVRWTPTGEGKP